MITMKLWSKFKNKEQKKINKNKNKEQKKTICSNMDGPEILIPSEVSQIEKDKYKISLICGILKKKRSNELKTEV